MGELRKIAENAGIDTIAVCGAERFDEVAYLLEAAKAKGELPPFTSEDIELRVDPAMTLPNAKAFIVIASPYTPTIYQPAAGLYGNIAPSACGEDYHRIVMRKLKVLCEALAERYPEHSFMPFVDTSPFSEKHLAVRAGLGQILHNGLFYSYAYGSRCFIGLILTDLSCEILKTAFSYDGAVQEDIADQETKVKAYGAADTVDSAFCKNCRRCERMCPGGAISDEGFDSYRCVSWLTQKKEELTEDEKQAVGHQIYGCDVCQRVCPQNPLIPAGYETGEEVSLEEIMALTGGSFKKTYKATAAGWRGKNLLIRNAKIAYENATRQKGDMPWQHGTQED